MWFMVICPKRNAQILEDAENLRVPRKVGDGKASRSKEERKGIRGDGGRLKEKERKDAGT